MKYLYVQQGNNVDYTFNPACYKHKQSLLIDLCKNKYTAKLYWSY